MQLNDAIVSGDITAFDALAAKISDWKFGLAKMLKAAHVNLKAA